MGQPGLAPEPEADTSRMFAMCLQGRPSIDMDLRKGRPEILPFVPSRHLLGEVAMGSAPFAPSSPPEETPSSMDVTPSPAEAVVPDAVVIDGATKRFGDDVAVDAIDLTVPTGIILGIIGPSGAGKTTTVRMLTGALAPTDGQVRVLGEDPRHFRRQTRERIGYMPQQFTLYPDLTARENVDFVASLFGLLWRTRYRRTREVLQLVDLWDVRGRSAGALSGGIDPLLRARIWEELHRLRDAGRTLLVTTQYVNEAESCDRVALISGGRLAALAPPEELRRLAIGGDVVEIETAGVFEGAALRELEVVRSVEQIDPHHLRVIVNDAAKALPEVVEAVGERGGEVTSAREARPSFDAVFATLVERDRAEHEPANQDGDGSSTRDAA